MLSNEPAAVDDEAVEKGSAVKTLRKALLILDHFATSERPLTVGEVAQQLGIARPTAYRLVQTLISEGYLHQNKDDKRISPGYSILRLASTLLDTNRLRIESLPHLESLSQLVGERTNLGILHKNQLLYLAGVEKPSLPTLYSRFGKVIPAYSTSLGKAILSFLPKDELDTYLKDVQFIPSTENTIIDTEEFLLELQKTRSRGYATDNAEHAVNTYCLAVPIWLSGRVVASVGVTGRSLDALTAHLDDVKHTAELIEHALSRDL